MTTDLEARVAALENDVRQMHDAVLASISVTQAALRASVHLTQGDQVQALHVLDQMERHMREVHRLLGVASDD